MSTIMADPIVLVVDEEQNLVSYCQQSLETANFKVLAANNVNQSLAILVSQPIDLLLVDICVSSQGGFQFLHLARTHQPELVDGEGSQVELQRIGDYQETTEDRKPLAS